MFLEVPDLVCQDYSSTPLRGKDRLIRRSSLLRDPSSSKPPPIPPPPEKYISPTEMCNSLSHQLTPPLSPPSAGWKIGRRQFMLPPGPRPDDGLDQEEAHVGIESFPREQLRLIEKFGEGKFGSVHLCEVQPSPCDCRFDGVKLVVIHTLSSETDRDEFVKEVGALCKLNDPNVARILGACLDSRPICAIREYGEMGDLCQFLQRHIAETATPLSSVANTLRYSVNFKTSTLSTCKNFFSSLFSYGCLIHMATQIASGMKYLETLNFVHKDLATR